MGALSKLAPVVPNGSTSVGVGRVAEIILGSRSRTIGLVAIVASSMVYVVTTRNWAMKSNRPELLQTKKEDGAARQKVAVDGVFFSRLWRLLKILIPGPFTPESGFMVLVAAMMLSRTWCDVWMLKNGTAIERTIITRDFQGFVVVFLNFVMAFFPIALVNNLLRYGLNELALRFRTRLTQHLYQEYLNGTYSSRPQNLQFILILFIFSSSFSFFSNLLFCLACLPPQARANSLFILIILIIAPSPKRRGHRA
jgi:hypothetical protein